MKPNHATVALPVFLALTAACSGGGASNVGLGGDAGGPTSEGGATTADGGDGTPPSDGGSGSDAPVSRGDAGTDGGPAKEAPIDPLAVGNTWTYAVTEVGSYPLCPSGTHDGKVIGSSQRDGKLAYETQSLCARVGTYYYATDGDVVYWDNASTWVLVLDAPVAEGHTWSNGVTAYVWHDVGRVTVTAGTFEKCFKAQDTQGPSYTIFCRGVGPVRWSFRDSLGNGYDAVLTAKNF